MEYSVAKLSRGSAVIIMTTPCNTYILQHRDDIKGIEYPDYWSLIGGWIERGENPINAIKRELKEELTTINGSPPVLGDIVFLGSCERNDRSWVEYVFCVIAHNSIDTLKILEGQGLGQFSFEQCCKLEKIAPHHKKHIVQYHDQIKAIIEN